ncbi:DNA ligase, ATP-dependent, central [Kalmanozyma brasiliensis GHG001]|uniref:ATP-dependent DNA ligase family profile domain-containing protein n=1 Tax=Kalmanozyma brasiliensis (strain GHG001) TaxID=1365824 RepID=V5EBF9_KALBG|nr:DNA ligase, ATP-dependent, central [Kalmanozyma brasiliensis GHG001]EST07741.1 DNA ligase, ATP-dependent, central [Kalmanozyma brasiliensis GHG001]
MSAMLTSISMADVIDPVTAILHIPKMIRQDEYGYRTSVDGKEVTPLTVIPLNEPFRITKAGSPSFILKRFREGYYVCSCPAWKFSTERDKMRKTCAHLKDVLGEQYETDRVALAKEAKSTIFEHSKFRRTTSDGHHARHSHAKGLLDDHFRQMSQSESQLDVQGTTHAAGPSTSAAASSSSKTIDIIASDRPRTPPPKTSGLSSKAKARAKDDSDTETEDEMVVGSQAGPSRPSQAAAITSTQARQSRPAYDDSDENEYGLDPDDVQLSPSKRARRGKRSAVDDDDKVSLLLAKPWLLDADPSKPRPKAMDPTGWWISEKLDGVRAFWDGQRLYSRQKIEWNAPPWWKDRLPKDITLDGELWMARGAFDQTSQICRTTVRLGRLRTFTHFMERDSMERQWLREQVGGRLASQDRLHGERSAVSLLRSTARKLDKIAAKDTRPASAIPSPSAWKTWKRAQPRAASGQVERTRRSLSEALGRSGVAGVFLRALFGRSSTLVSRSLPAPRSRLHRLALLRCPRCGKIVKRTKIRDAGLAEEERANANQLLSVPSLPSAPPTPLRASNTVSLRRPHIYSMRNTSTSGLSARTIPSTYTHVCRRKTKSSNEWNRIKFMVFDSPSMGSRPVEERWAELEQRFGSTDGLDIDSLEGPQIKLVKHIKCKGRSHLAELMESVEVKGGEGLMLRQPGSKYEGKRGNTLFKLKNWYDAEAVVTGYAPGTGRHEGRTGSLVAQMACGTTFRVGTGMSDAQRDNPPPIGTIINYRFFELSEDGYPRFPAFRGIARDKSKPKDAVVRPRAGAIRAAAEERSSP